MVRAQAKYFFGGTEMNGLKLIRIMCNFSQTKLAEELHVSRQAINMWENGRKNIPEERKQQLCEFFGISDPLWLDEIDEETKAIICEQPMYRAKEELEDEKSVHYFFTPEKCRYGNFGGKYFYPDDLVSIDEKCVLRREELKALLNRIQNYASNVEKENSHEAMGRIRRTVDPINALLDAMEVGDRQKSILKIPHFYTVFAVIDAMNVAFHNISESELAPRCSMPLTQEDSSYRERYDYRPLTLRLVKEISDHFEHIEALFEEIDSKRHLIDKKTET